MIEEPNRKATKPKSSSDSFSLAIFMSKLTHSNMMLLALRLLIGGVFIYAGATKIGNPMAFADSIATFQLLPAQLINLVALGLPPFEILVGLMLVLGFKVRASSLGLVLLCVVFALALGQALARGLDVDCGCFGSGKPSVLNTWLSLGRDLVLATAAAFLYLSANLASKQNLAPSPQTPET